MSYLDSADAEPVSITNYERWASMGRTDLVQPLLRSLTNQAEKLIDKGQKRNGVLTESEERELESVMVQARHAKDLVNQSQDAHQRLLTKYPEMWRNTTANVSPEWMEFKRGLPTRFSIPVGQGLAARVVKNGQVETRDLLVSSTGTVPSTVFSELLTRMVLQSAVLSSNVRMVTTNTGENILMPRLTAFGTAALVAEAGSFAESDPTFATITMGAFKFGNLLQVSDELISDSAFDIERFVGQSLGTQIGQSIASYLITGSGTAQPEGIMTNCTVGVTSSTAVAGVPSIANVLSLYSSLPAQYRDGSSFVMHPDTYAGIVALNDTTGRSLVLPDLTSAQPLQMLGKPVYLDTNVATTATNAKSIFFGNLAEYSAVRMVNSVQVLASPDFAFANGLVTLRSQLRLDAKVLNTDAGRCFKGASS